MLVSGSDTHLSTYFVHKFCKFSTSHVHFGLDKESRRLLPPLRWTISRYFVCIAYQENLNTIAEFECGWLNISTSSSQRTAPVRRFHLRAKRPKYSINKFNKIREMTKHRYERNIVHYFRNPLIENVFMWCSKEKKKPRDIFSLYFQRNITTVIRFTI